MNSPSQRTRILFVCVLFFLVIITFKIIDAAQKNIEIITDVSTVYSTSFLEGGESAEEAIRNYPTTMLSNYNEALPSDFEAECISQDELAAEHCSCYASTDGDSIMVLSDKSPEIIFNLMKEKLSQAGWSYQESGIQGKETFVKANGIHHWLLLESWTTTSGSMTTFVLKRAA